MHLCYAFKCPFNLIHSSTLEMDSLGSMPPIISCNIGTISFLQSSHIISEAVVHDVLDPDTNCKAPKGLKGST
jgi:hypothetical protein